MVRGGALVGAPPLLAVLLYVMATTRERLFYGGAFVLFHLTFELMRVLCEAEGARCVARARYRGSARFVLVGGIGINTCMALALQSALQALFQAAIPELEMQFKSLAALLVLLGAFFCLDALGFAALSLLSRCGRQLDDPSAANGGQETPPRYHEWDDRSAATR